MTQIKSNAREASKREHCPLCDRDHYCFLIGDPIDRIICQWTDPNNPPQGWNYVGESKDRRPMFGTAKQRHKSKRYPDLISLPPQDFGAIPEWQTLHQGDMSYSALSVGDIAFHARTGQFYEIRGRVGRKSGGQQRTFLKAARLGERSTQEIFEEELQIATFDPQTGAELQQIEYLYPAPITHQPLGKVIRRQWTDRRAWFEECRKSKQVRPWHWEGTPEKGSWKPGRGERAWPLYREEEAKEAILKGGIVFAVGGEQAVEEYRSLGLTACTNGGGEGRWHEIPDRLQNAFELAKDDDLKPILAIHPDFDLAGDSLFGKQLLMEARKRGITAITMNPQHIWGAIPHGGDIREIVELSGMAPSEILQALEYAIDEAIDRQEKEEQLIKQRLRWNAPDSVQGELGYWHESKDGSDSHFTPLTNFDLQIEKEVASPDGGGFVIQLKRAGEHRQYRLFLPSLEFTSVQQFENCLKKALGGVIICRLTTNQVKALLRVRLHEYTHNRGGKVYRLAQQVGQQPDRYWVFPRCQLNPAGELSDENKSLWIWNTGLTGDESTLPKPSISPPNSEALASLVRVMRRFFGPKNIYPAILTLGYAAAACHYQQIIEEEGAFPILNLIGDAGSGKTLSATCALSLMGMHTEAAGGMLRDVSISAAYEHLKITGSLLHCLDDPARTPELDEFLKGLYNGKARLVRGQNGAAFNMQRPHSPLMVTSNFACGETNAATMSRLLQLWFDNADKGDLDAYPEFTDAWARASGALPDLIRVGYPRDAIANIEKHLLQFLPHAHSRIARSLALVVAYTEAICHLAGEAWPLAEGAANNIAHYAIHTVCAMANDVENSADSLRDFMDRLFILRSQAKVGEWNMRFITESNSARIKSLALNIQSVWATLDSNFKLPYNLRIIKHLLQGKGAIMVSRQKFHCDEDVSKAFQRGSTNDPHWQVKRCVEIPVDLIRHYADLDLEIVNGVSTVSTGDAETPESLMEKGDGRLTSICQPNVNREKKCQPEIEAPISVDKNGCQPEGSVDMCMSTGSDHAGQGFEPVIESRLTRLTRKMPANVIEKNEVPQNGDLVLVNGAGKWIRQGSDKLPWRELTKDLRQAEEIPLSALPPHLAAELEGISKVLSISRDGQRVKVRQQESGRNSVFEISDVVIYQRAGVESNANG